MADDDEFAPAEYVSDEEQVNDEIETQPVKGEKKQKKNSNVWKDNTALKNNFFNFKEIDKSDT